MNKALGQWFLNIKVTQFVRNPDHSEFFTEQIWALGGKGKNVLS